MTTVSDETSNVVPAEPDPDSPPNEAVIESEPDGQTVSPATDGADSTEIPEASEVPEVDEVSEVDETDEVAEADEVTEVDATDATDAVTEADEADASDADEADASDEATAVAEIPEADAPVDGAPESDTAVDAETPVENAEPAAAAISDDAESPVAVAPESAETQLDPDDTEWWKNAVFYQIYPRSFSDLNGDGVGDLAGVIDKLGYLELLGIDALWLSPIMRSPMADHGYDVSDPRDIDPIFGDLAAFDELVTEAHDRDIRVTMDLVPNHTSDQHRWFVDALAAEPDSPERARYIFRDGVGENGDEPPNNWHSVFGGPAWTRVTEADGTPGQWYLHIFAAEQPDLNWENPEVFDDLEKTLRFWLDRGVDGFRIDVAHGMAKPEDLPDMDLEKAGLLSNSDDDPRFNNYAVHEIHRKIRSVMDDYPGAANVGEVWVEDNERFAEYLRPDELHLGFNFRLAKTPFAPEAIRDAIENSLASVLSVGGTPTWTLSNHDVDREVSRYGRLDDTAEVDIDLGIHRARAMLLVEMALPGSIFIYNGAELGLPNADLPDDALQDPVWARSGHTERGRDGCRVPLPWEGLEPPFGFTAGADTWLPMPDTWARFTVEAQLEDIDSTLSLYREAIELRYQRPEFAGETVEWYGAPEGCLAFRRSAGHLVCALNTSDVPVPLPPGEVLLSSYPLVDGQLAPNSSAWLV